MRLARTGLAEPVWGRDAHAVTRDPMVTGDARAAALCGGGRGGTAREREGRLAAETAAQGGRGGTLGGGSEGNRCGTGRRRRATAHGGGGESGTAREQKGAGGVGGQGKGLGRSRGPQGR
jgi:hypothetical protein